MPEKNQSKKNPGRLPGNFWKIFRQIELISKKTGPWKNPLHNTHQMEKPPISPLNQMRPENDGG
jgi:hypothetical protein